MTDDSDSVPTGDPTETPTDTRQGPDSDTLSESVHTDRRDSDSPSDSPSDRRPTGSSDRAPTVGPTPWPARCYIAISQRRAEARALALADAYSRDERRDTRRASRRDRRAERRQARRTGSEDRPRRWADAEVWKVRVGNAALIMAMGVALYGQAKWLSTTLQVELWQAFGGAGFLEAMMLGCSGMSMQRRRKGRHAVSLRVLGWLASIAAGAMNYAHFAGDNLLAPDPLGVFFGAASVFAFLFYELSGNAKVNDALEVAGLAVARLRLAQWIADPPRAWRTWRYRVLNPHTALEAAWARCAKPALRMRTAYRIGKNRAARLARKQDRAANKPPKATPSKQKAQPESVENAPAQNSPVPASESASAPEVDRSAPAGKNHASNNSGAARSRKRTRATKTAPGKQATTSSAPREVIDQWARDWVAAHGDTPKPADLENGLQKLGYAKTNGTRVIKRLRQEGIVP